MTKNKNKEKMPIIWGISIFFCILIFLISIFISFNKDKEPNNKVDNNQNDNIIYTDNKDIISDKNIGDVTFTNIECSFDGFNSLLTYTITNNSKETIILGNYELIVKDKNNNILAIMVPGDTKELKPTETINIENIIDIDLTKTYKLELNKTE